MDAFNILFWLFLSQVSYQGLDTENQRLQKALENSSKKIQQLEEELQEVETENQSLQRNLEELKISSKRLEQLEQEVGEKTLLWQKKLASKTQTGFFFGLCLKIMQIFATGQIGWLAVFY